MLSYDVNFMKIRKPQKMVIFSIFSCTKYPQNFGFLGPHASPYLKKLIWPIKYVKVCGNRSFKPLNVKIGQLDRLICPSKRNARKSERLTQNGPQNGGFLAATPPNIEFGQSDPSKALPWAKPRRLSHFLSKSDVRSDLCTRWGKKKR